MNATRRRTASPLASFEAPVSLPAERRAAGKALRAETPRTSHAGWSPPTDRRDPIEVLVESNRTRVPDLVPLRYERMAASPFAFLRGSALGMAYDLAHTPVSGLQVRLCGDAHIANFGTFASPERRLVFDLNDFDEAAPGPFEWDLKRMAASVAVAGRENGYKPDEVRRAVRGSVTAYLEWMDRYSAMTHLDVWYARLDVSDLMEQLDTPARRQAEETIRRASTKTHMKALSKLTEVVDGRRRIISDPPVIERYEGEGIRQRLESVLSDYRGSLDVDKQTLFDHYRFVDFARKVVGVGSVGTRCWIALFQGPNGGPLFLQLKEARPSAPELALGTPTTGQHHGRRVVEGQKLLQTVNDVLLGWGTDSYSGIHYFARQLWDAKGSVDIAAMRFQGFLSYTWFCGWALAHAHARTGDSATIAGYLGTSGPFPDALADFADQYADQTVRDHALLVKALADGTLPST